jgi:hypothetical protein
VCRAIYAHYTLKNVDCKIGSFPDVPLPDLALCAIIVIIIIVALVRAQYTMDLSSAKKEKKVSDKKQSLVMVGLKPNRGSHGILNLWPHKLSAKDKKQILKFMK